MARILVPIKLVVKRSLSSGANAAAYTATRVGSMKWNPRDNVNGTYCCDLIYAAAGIPDDGPGVETS
jgi:hypothetical protein